MLLETHEKLEELIVRQLAGKPGVTAAWLHARICADHQPCSLQAVYQGLRKLTAGGVVVKLRDEYSLRLAWVLSMLELTDTMYESHINGSSMKEVLPERGGRKTWSFSDLRSLAGFYSQLILYLHQQTGDKLLFEHVPHVWYHLAYGEAETQFLKAVHVSPCTYYLIVSGDAYLDRLYLRTFGATRGEISFGQTPFSAALRERYFCTVGPYYAWLRIQPALAGSIDRLFAAVASARDVSIGRINDVMHARSKISLILEHNPAKAAKTRRQFLGFFGVSDPDKDILRD